MHKLLRSKYIRCIFAYQFYLTHLNYSTMKKINAGYYKGIYKGIEFEIIKLQYIKENLWYWKIGDKDVEDHYTTKYVAILAVKEYIDEI